MEKFTQKSVRRMLLRISNVQFWSSVIIVPTVSWFTERPPETRNFVKTKNKPNNTLWLDPQNTAIVFHQASSYLYFTQLLMKLFLRGPTSLRGRVAFFKPSAGCASGLQHPSEKASWGCLKNTTRTEPGRQKIPLKTPTKWLRISIYFKIQTKA